MIENLKEEGIIELISSYVKPNSRVKLGIGDDCAVIDSENLEDILVTTDMLVEGTHFLIPKFEAKGLGSKSMLSNISDIVAMGGKPLFALLSIGLRPTTNVEFLKEFIEGFVTAGEKYGVSLIGGDTVRGERIVISVTLIGTCKRERYVTRKGVGTEEAILITGIPGESAIGLEAIIKGYQEKNLEYFIKKHYEPEIKMELARVLAEENLITSMIDISDGLYKDAERISKINNIAIVIEEEKLPLPQLNEEVQKILEKPIIDYVLFGGEDYELLFTVKKYNLERVLEISEKLGVKVTQIGFTKPGLGVYIKRGEEIRELQHKGFEHF